MARRIFAQERDHTVNEYSMPNSHPKDGPVTSLDEEIDSIGKKDVR